MHTTAHPSLPANDSPPARTRRQLAPSTGARPAPVGAAVPDPVYFATERVIQLLLSVIPAWRTPIAGVTRVIAIVESMLAMAICEGALPVEAGAHALGSLSLLRGFRLNTYGSSLRACDAHRLAEILTFLEAPQADPRAIELVEYVCALPEVPRADAHQSIANLLIGFARRHNADLGIMLSTVPCELVDTFGEEDANPYVCEVERLINVTFYGLDHAEAAE